MNLKTVLLSICGLFVFCIICYLLYCLISPSEKCETETKYGSVIGRLMKSRNGKEFCAFNSIPYAEPPVNELRFLPPVTPKHWKSTLDAKSPSHSLCMQFYEFHLESTKTIGREDCLYLNVFTRNTKVSILSPVMVFIHDGGFFMGSSFLIFYGPEYLMDEDVVLVTLQYRVGPFGFLSTGDGVIPGNMGLKDQVKALEWVQGNINYFGGDPNKVTLFGNSAGASSVHLHMLSPLSQNLFAQGISQSGTALSGFAIAEQKLCQNTTQNMALTLKCSISNSKSIYECIKDKNSTDIMNAYQIELNRRYNFNKILFRPVVEPESDHAFITENPKKGITSKPWIVGMNANEGIFALSDKNVNEARKLMNTSFDELISKVTLFEYLWNINKNSAQSLQEFYFNNVSSQDGFIKSMEKIITDSWFLWPTGEALNNHKGPVYHYLYDHRSEHSFAEKFGALEGLGVSHIDEIIALFSLKGFFPRLNDQDTNISKVIVKMWVNFAAEGNPTPSPISSDPQKQNVEDFTWMKFNSKDSNYIHIETNKLSMKNQIFPERMQFWKSLQLNSNN